MAKQYPVLPLRNTTLFPENILPLAVGRPRSVALIEEAYKKVGDDGMIVLLSQKDENVDAPTIGDIYQVGTLARIIKVVKVSDEHLTVVVQGVRRVRLTTMLSTDPYFVGEFEDVLISREGDTQEAALAKSLRKAANDVIEKSPEAPKETPQVLDEMKDSEKLCYFIGSSLEVEVAEKQEILGQETLKTLIQSVLQALNKQLQAAKLADHLHEKMMEETDKNQREYYLRQQLKAIKKELGDEEGDLDDLEIKIDDSDLPEEVYNTAMRQLGRLRAMQPSSSEYSVTLNYIETLLDIPWKITSDDNMDLKVAQEILDEDHYSLDKVKNRIIEYLAVRKLKSDMKGPILCLAGPPGVGKTSLGRSIARTLGRKFVRISLGGVHDESEIRGHRRTYVGAMPGRLVKALIKAGTNNPVIMLDEIDKIGKDFRGDPQAAMLEVLDPEQNNTFSDHFVELPVDLSNVLFIATANQLSTVSAPLRDRMEIIEVPSYTSFEKNQIARRHLIPKQVDNHGITDNHIQFENEALDYVIDRYTREAGVRNLERRVADICRSVAVKVAKAEPEDRDSISQEVTKDFVVDALGPERYHSEIAQRVSVPGVSTGLAWTQAGGDILFIEASKTRGKGNFKFTGQLGDVMTESCEAAISYLKANARDFGLEEDYFNTHDLHIHFPAGAVPKDGPSAGITIFSAVLSILTGINVRNDVAMTGEITLRGSVLPVGGIKEKITAAHRAGIKRVVIPAICEKDLVDVSDEIKADLEFFFVDRVEEIPALVLEEELPKVPVVPANPDDIKDPNPVVN